MRNRAKCRECKSIIESFHSMDMVTCKCGKISVSGGEALYCAADDWKYFIRIDDQDNEIVPKVIEKKKYVSSAKVVSEGDSAQSKKELIDSLDHMIESYNSLPTDALTGWVTNYELVSALSLISAIFRACLLDCKEEI